MCNIYGNVWARRKADSTVTVGPTSYACSLAGEIVFCTPKKVGKIVEKDKSCATVVRQMGRSGEGTGGRRSGGGERRGRRQARHHHQDPCNRAWVVKLKPANWDADSANLKTGAAAMAAFVAKMQADGFKGC